MDPLYNSGYEYPGKRADADIVTLVVGIPFFHNLEEVAGNSSRICKTTHNAPVCVAASVLLSTVVALLLQVQQDSPALLLVQSFSMMMSVR